MVTYGDTDGSGMDGGQWSPAQCPPPTGHPPHCSALYCHHHCVYCRKVPKQEEKWLDTRPQSDLPGMRPVDCGSCSIHQYYNLDRG